MKNTPLKDSMNIDDYQPIDYPRLEDFMVTATPKNSAFIQASMATGREVFPPFSMYLEWFLNNDEIVLPAEYTYKASYPRYLLDASIYEVFNIYNVPMARDLVRELSYNDMFAKYMAQQGYVYHYFMFVKPTSPMKLTPSALEQSLTPDQKILLEAWRQRALTSFVSPDPNDVSAMNYSNFKVLGLRDQKRQLISNVTAPTNVIGPIDISWAYEKHAPVINEAGYARFDRFAIASVVSTINERLKQQANPGVQKYRTGYYVTPGITRQYIMREGEQALSNTGKDISKKTVPMPLPANPLGTKAYFAMIYLELAKRGLIDANGNPTV